MQERLGGLHKHQTYTMRYGVLVIRHKVAKKYLCYNSYAEEHWFWGRKDQAERFNICSDITERLLLQFSESYIDFMTTPQDESLVIEERMR